MLQKEIALLEKPKKGAPFALSANGKVIGGKMPDQLTERDYKVAKMLGEVPEAERKQLQKLINEERRQNLLSVS